MTTMSRLALPVVLVAAVAAFTAGCEKRPADAPMTPSTSTTPAPMAPASAASR